MPARRTARRTLDELVAAAYLLYRAQQLRQMSESLMHTAMRLVRPQDIGVDNLASAAMAIREEMHALFLSALEARGARYADIRGGWDERRALAIAAIDQLLGGAR